tara:strand:+ start:2803 stop:3054 length:252 start_codon:yes stop_codon:yes gene_type:complete
MTEADLIELGFIKQVQDSCCTPEKYTFYKQVGNGSPFITPDSSTITGDNWPAENFAINFKTYIKSDLIALIDLMEKNPLFPPS